MNKSKPCAKCYRNLLSIHNRFHTLRLNLNDESRLVTVDRLFGIFLQRGLEKFQSAHRLPDDSSSEQSRRKL
jgi:hypothetical protein